MFVIDSFLNSVSGQFDTSFTFLFYRIKYLYYVRSINFPWKFFDLKYFNQSVVISEIADP